MTLLEKRQKILDYIAEHNDEFIRQAKFKINKQIARDSSDHRELVSDVLFSVINKLDKTDQINYYYRLVKEDKLFVYLAKAIDNNCKFTKAPFLRAKLAIVNRITFNDETNKMMVETYSEEPQTELGRYIFSLLSTDKAPSLFGPHWKYYVTIFMEYINEPDCTYQKLADKYKIPKPTIAANIMTIKKIIRNDVQKNYQGN